MSNPTGGRGPSAGCWPVASWCAVTSLPLDSDNPCLVDGISSIMTLSINTHGAARVADDELYITAAEAATELGVSRATLYAYVSRRGIRTKRDPGTRESLYWRSDIMKAKQKRGPIAPEKVAGTDYVETALTFMTEKGAYYRGVSAIEAADRYSLEDVAALLWGVERDAIFRRSAAAAANRVRAPARAGRPSRRHRSRDGAAALVEAANPRSYDLSSAGMAATGADVLRTLAAILLRKPDFSGAPAHLCIAEALGLSDMWADVVRRLMVLSADNGLEAGPMSSARPPAPASRPIVRY